jgi:hypothetical protein
LVNYGRSEDLSALGSRLEHPVLRCGSVTSEGVNDPTPLKSGEPPYQGLVATGAS